MFDSLCPWFVLMFRALCQALPRAVGANAEVYFLGRYLVLKIAKPAVHDAIEYEAMVHHALASGDLEELREHMKPLGAHVGEASVADIGLAVTYLRAHIADLEAEHKHTVRIEELHEEALDATHLSVEFEVGHQDRMGGCVHAGRPPLERGKDGGLDKVHDPPPLVGHYAYIPWLRTLVLPYCGPTLSNYTQRGGPKLKIPAVVHCARRIFTALEYLHMRGFVHRDIKPDNMCYKQECGATVIDVGSTILEGATNVPASGTSPLYIPPEHVLLDDPPPTSQTDLWAAGIVLFLLVEQTFPFFQSNGSLPINLNSFRCRISEYEVPLTFRTPTHPLHQVIKTLLAYDPKERFLATATDVLCALEKMSYE